MIKKNKAESEYLSKGLVVSEINKSISSSVLCFSTIQKAKKLTEAKRRVYQAASKLNW